MARVRYEVVVKREGKEGKVFWNKIGVVLQTEKGFSLKLESVPVGWDGFAGLFEPKAKNDAPQQKPEDSPPW